MTPLRERFEKKYIPEPMSGCWLWLGGKNEHGYGIICLGGRSDGVAKAHRVSYELHVGKIQPGMVVIHRCDNPGCVNPDHLRLGTMKDNSRDMVAKNRHRIPDNRGVRAAWSKLTAESVRDIRTRRLSALKFAKLYGVSRAAIYNIWCGTSWESV